MKTESPRQYQRMERGWLLTGIAFRCLIATACGGHVAEGSASTGDASGPDSSIPASHSGAASGDGVGASGFSSGMSAGAAGSSGSTSGSAGSDAGQTGSSGSISGSSGPVTSGMSSSGMSASGAVAPSEGGTTIVEPRGAGPGCGKPWLGMTGQWVAQPTGCDQGLNHQGTAACQAIPPGAVVPTEATVGSPEQRGWWVYVPNGYNPDKPYKVIYEGTGCGENNWFNAGKDGFPYNTVDNDDAILVGLDYDTFSDVPGCYDSRDPQSNDLMFFPWLQNEIERELCVDTSAEFFSGYSNGAQVGQQFDCAFPDKLRGFVSVTGCEPGAPGFPGTQYSPCAEHPTAAFFVKDFNDWDNTYACILPACQRVLKQNGCSVSKCDPLDATLTTPYPVPTGVTLPSQARCVQFNGCPADYPVVFCVTYDQGHGDDQSWGVVQLFWDFIKGLSPP
jgi:hypothetical protein